MSNNAENGDSVKLVIVVEIDKNLVMDGDPWDMDRTAEDSAWETADLLLGHDGQGAEDDGDLKILAATWIQERRML